MARKLWQHQREAFDFALRTIGIGETTMTIVGRQGCGKSSLCVAIAASLVDDPVVDMHGAVRKVHGVVFCAPMLTIVSNFAEHAQVSLPPGLRPGAKPERVVDVSSWWAKVEGREGLEAWFDRDRRKHPFVAITHQALRLWALSLPERLDGYVLVLDEIHHAPLAESLSRTVIGEVRDTWTQRGGIVIQTSATPWHTDSEMLVYRLSDPFYQISATDLALAGLGPNRFDVGRVVLPYEPVDIREWLDPTCINVEALTQVYALLVQEWMKLGRPVTLVRHPDNKHVEPLRHAFESKGARVLDATGTMSKDAVASLSADRGMRSYEDRSIDVVLASRRFDEGTDLPSISSVFYLGSPTSLRHVLQLYGRAMRDRSQIDGYPEEHVRRATLRFFVPRPTKKILDHYMEEHHVDAIGIATYLADYQVGHAAIEALSSKLKASFVRNRPPSQETVVNDVLIQRFMLTEHAMHKARSDVRQIVARLASAEDLMLHEVSIPMVAREIASMPQNRQRARLQTAFLFEASSSAPQISSRLRKIMSTVLEEREQKNLTIAQAELDYRRELHAFVTEIAKEWSSLTTMAWSAEVLRIISEFTGADAKKIAAQIRRRALPKPHRYEVVQAVRLFLHRRGTWPKRTSGSAERYGLPGFTWKQVDDHWPTYRLPGENLEQYGRDHVRGR